MYQFNLRAIKTFLNGDDWVTHVLAEQEEVKIFGMKRSGGFAIHKDLLSKEPTRIVLPNRIWVFKAWKVDHEEIKKMIFKGLNIKLFSNKSALSPDREYAILKPLYTSKRNNYVTYNGVEGARFIEYKQPFYVVDVTEKDYLVFFELFGIIANADLGEIKQYNEQSGGYDSDAKRNYKTIYTHDKLAAILVPTADSEQYSNAPQLIIGVRPTSCVINIGEPSFSIKNVHELTDLDYEAYADTSLIIAPMITYAGPDWILGGTL